MKKTKIKIGIILILSLFFIIMCLNIYKQSPRYIIKDTVMWYEKDFTIPLFCKKVKFEYDKKSGNYTGKFAISEKQKDSLFDNLKEFNERSVNVTNSIDKYKGNLRDLDKKTLNTTMVSYNLLYKYYFKKEKKNIWKKFFAKNDLKSKGGYKHMPFLPQPQYGMNCPANAPFVQDICAYR